MIKLIFIAAIFLNFLFAQSQNISLLNKIKKVVQKEEYIALAINKYIVDTGTIPQTASDNDGDGFKELDWTKLESENYLGSSFNRTNSLTSKDMNVYFKDGFAFIRGAIETQTDFNSDYLFLYNYYIDQTNRVNTLPPKDNTKEQLVNGTLVKYDLLQKEIVTKITSGEVIKKTADCTTSATEANNYFYEIEDSKLVYKYCYSDGNSFDVYSDGKNHVYSDDTFKSKVLAPIGTKVFTKAGTEVNEYYFQSSSDTKEWASRTIIGAGDLGGTGTGGGGGGSGNLPSGEIPSVSGEKILVLRKNLGCMLVGGDISCWGENVNNKFGVDTTTNPNSDYLLTPVMLKTATTEGYYNSINRTKYKAVALNSSDVCAISTNDKLYCAGSTNSKTILTKVLDDVISVAMTNNAIAIVKSDGTLRSGSDFNNLADLDTSTSYSEVFSTTRTRTFGALTASKRLKIWGARSTVSYSAPTDLNTDVEVSEVIVNPSEFIVKGTDSKYYVTSNDNSLTDTTIGANSIAVLDDDGTVKYTYVNSTKDLATSPDNYLVCENPLSTDGTCDTTETNLFNNSLANFSQSVQSVAVYQDLELIDETNYPGEEFTSGQTIEWNLVDGSSDPNKNSYITCVTESYESNQDPSKYYRCGIKPNSVETTVYIQKEFDFGVDYKNSKVIVTLNLLEIDDWDEDTFFAKSVDLTDPNNIIETTLFEATLSNDSLYSSKTDDLPGEILDYNLYDTPDLIDELHKVGFEANLDENGKIIIKIGAEFDEEKFENKNTSSNNATFGVDKFFVKIDASSMENNTVPTTITKVYKGYTCAVVKDTLNEVYNPKLYCWGQIDMSIPTLSTSLLNDSIIGQMNNYFYNSSSDVLIKNVYDEYYNDGVFLKYPTYISGFDYDFKFR